MYNGKGQQLASIGDQPLIEVVCRHCPLEGDGRPLSLGGLLAGVSWLEERITTMLCAWQISQELIVHPQPYASKELLAQIVDRWRATAAEPRLWLDLIFPTLTPTEMLAWNLDRAYFNLAMDHLLRNAIEFTPDGGAITLRLARWPATGFRSSWPTPASASLPSCRS